MGAFVLDGLRRSISKLIFLRIVFFRIELQYSHNSPVPITAPGKNHISGDELWRNGPFRGELPGFGFGGFPVRSSTTFTQNRAKLHENKHIKV